DRSLKRPALLRSEVRIGHDEERSDTEALVEARFLNAFSIAKAQSGTTEEFSTVQRENSERSSRNSAIAEALVVNESATAYERESREGEHLLDVNSMIATQTVSK